eukprot:gene7807-8005_t
MYDANDGSLGEVHMTLESAIQSLESPPAAATPAVHNLRINNSTIKDIKVLDAIFSGVLQRDSNNKRTDVLTIVTTVAWQMELLQMTIVEGNIKFGAQDNDGRYVIEEFKPKE